MFENPSKNQNTALAWKNYGNQLFKAKQNYLAIEAYLLGLQLCSEDDSIWKLINMNLAAAYLEASCFEKAAACTEIVIKKYPNEPKALHRAGKAYYNLRDYKTALNHFQKLKAITPNNFENVKDFDQTKQRIKESEVGAYDTFAIDRYCKPFKLIDCADYVGPVKVVEVPGRGRGIIVTEDVKPGTLLIVSKALAFAFIKSGEEVDELYSKVVQCVTKNPNFYVSKVYDLHSGDGYSHQEPTLFGDSENKLEPVVDVERIKKICATNVFSADRIYPADGLDPAKNDLTVETAGFGLFHLPSFINHSCIPNVYEMFYNDVMCIRACLPIKSGEEISFSYVPLFGLSFEERQQRLRSRGFSCTCFLCQLDENERLSCRHHREDISKLLYGIDVGCSLFLNSLSKRLVVQAEETYTMSDRKILKYNMFPVYINGIGFFDTTKVEKESWIKQAIQSLGFDTDKFLECHTTQKLTDLLESNRHVLVTPRLFLGIVVLIKFYVATNRRHLARIWLKLYCELVFIIIGEDERLVKKRLPSFSHLF
ncbi:hypothetical protein CHUAL_001697 [Chamberlinius hualienensis]